MAHVGLGCGCVWGERGGGRRFHQPGRVLSYQKIPHHHQVLLFYRSLWKQLWKQRSWAGGPHLPQRQACSLCLAERLFLLAYLANCLPHLHFLVYQSFLQPSPFKLNNILPKSPSIRGFLPPADPGLFLGAALDYGMN